MPIEKTCENCGNSFFSYPSDKRLFCSLDCRSAKRFDKPNVAPGREVLNFTCKKCGSPFGMMQSYYDAYLKKHKKGPLYCSRPCSDAGRAKDSEQRNTFTCLNCKQIFTRSRKPGGRIYAQQKYCGTKCKGEYRSNQALERFKTGGYKTHVKRHGYVWITIPLLGRTGRKFMLEHRYKMQRSLGRDLLKDETVHHINGNRQDNRIENLELFSSRHGPGQRVVDKVQFAIEILTLYPEFARAAGVELHRINAVPVPGFQTMIP